jgi:hypothetical protein
MALNVSMSTVVEQLAETLECCLRDTVAPCLLLPVTEPDKDVFKDVGMSRGVLDLAKVLCKPLVSQAAKRFPLGASLRDKLCVVNVLCIQHVLQLLDVHIKEDCIDCALQFMFYITSLDQVVDGASPQSRRSIIDKAAKKLADTMTQSACDQGLLKCLQYVATAEQQLTIDVQDDAHVFANRARSCFFTMIALVLCFTRDAQHSTPLLQCLGLMGVVWGYLDDLVDMEEDYAAGTCTPAQRSPSHTLAVALRLLQVVGADSPDATLYHILAMYAAITLHHLDTLQESALLDHLRGCLFPAHVHGERSVITHLVLALECVASDGDVTVE